MSLKMVLAVAAGGAAGAVGRYLMMVWVAWALGHGFPYGTLVVNILGSVAMGVLIEVSALAWSPSPELRALLVVGLLGGFTTFSTFSLDTVLLIERGFLLAPAVYIAGSVFLCVGGLWLGMRGMRLLL